MDTNEILQAVYGLTYMSRTTIIRFHIKTKDSGEKVKAES